MRRTPPNEDQQPEDTLGSYKARRQQTLTGQEPLQDDEHPEIPKIRRASLYLNAPPVHTREVGPIKQTRREQRPEEDWEQESRPTEQTRRTKRPRQERPEDDYQDYREDQETRLPERRPRLRQNREDYREILPPGQTTRRPRRERLEQDYQDYREEQESRLPEQTRRPRRDQAREDYREPPLTEQTTRRPRRERLDEDYQGYEDDREEQETYFPEQTRRPGPSSSDKIGVTRSQRPIAYEPPPANYHKPQGRPQRRQRRSQQALWAHIQDLSHNRAVLFAGTILIALIIIVPLLANLTQGHLAAVIQNMGGNPNAVPASGVQNSNRPGISKDIEHPAPPVFATAAYLLDADTGATLYAHNGSMRLPMMSTTKLMTGLLASQYGGNLDRKITINDAIANDINQLAADSSVMGAKKGETYTLRELLYGLMLPSGNDAALVIADAISGSVPKFVSLMNQRAQELGLNDTHYSNPHGLLADGHYSSAHDLAVLGKVVMDVPVLHQITGTQEYHIVGNNEHAEHFFSNGDQFMYWYPGVDGGKIGWDAGANFVQVISCTRNNHHLIGVTLHTIDWWTDMRDLMNWGFNSFTWLSPREINANVHPIPYAAAWNYFARDTRDRNIPMGNQGRYYVFTGYSVTQPIAGFFDKSGGLTKLGFPISQPQTVDTSLRQSFEHGTIQCDQGSKQCKLVA